MPKIEFLQGDAREVLKSLPPDSFDSWVTDPPSGTALLDQDWDDFGEGRDARRAFIQFLTEVAIQAYRVLKPGAYGLVWSLPRTSHWAGTALEDAGFEVRDTISHINSQGYPKNQYGLKPAHEVWWLIRKPGPLRPLRVEECRVQGRYPPNFGLGHLPECKEDGTKEVKGQKSRERPPDPKSKTGWGFKRQGGEMRYPTDKDGYETVPNWICAPGCPVLALNQQVPDSDRFFYIGKPDQEERNMGCQNLYWKKVENGLEPIEFVAWSSLPEGQRAQGNPHISVKAIGLMRHLVRLITPVGGRVLDCFSGSGGTALACLHEELDFLGVEKEPSYLTIATNRVAALTERLNVAKRQLHFPLALDKSSQSNPRSAESSLLDKADIRKLVIRAKRRNS
jgi:DNA modification methylase